VRYNTDLRDVELYENTATGWQAQDTARNFGGHNLVTYSEQFDNAAWTKTNISIVANSVRAPDGTLTADTWVENTSAGVQHAVNLASTVSASPNTYYTFSIYAKAAGRTRLYINFSDINFAGNAWNMDLSAVTISLSSSGWTSGTSSATITDVGNGWRRITITGQTTGSVTQVGPYIYLADNSGTVNYTGDGTSGAYFWGAQVERSNTAGPYVRTTTALSPTPTVLNGYRTHTYTTVGTSGFTPTVTGDVEVLVVAGGGGGSNYNSAGGGGAGGLIYRPTYPVIAGRSYIVTVGAGGVGAMTLSATYTDAIASATSGSNSQFGTLIAIGGGHGGQGNVQGSRTDQYPSAGGSGGGARESTGTVGAAGTAGQGNRGGAGGVYSGNYPGGGGGGAGAPGGDGIDNVIAGEGGAGLQFSISGTPTWYAGGGAGSTQGSGTNSPGGLGGGGAGGAGTGGSTQNGVSGTANTGGGGGAGGYNNTQSVGGNGGSGIVIVRYRYD
jgi:hypothetical protein